MTTKRYNSARPLKLVFIEIFRVVATERYTIFILLMLYLTFQLFSVLLRSEIGFDVQIGSLLSNLSADILGGIFIFIVLDRSIKHLSPIGEQEVFPTSEFIHIVRNSTSRKIDVLDTWTYLLNEKVYREEFIPALKIALRRGVRVKILIIDPNSDGAKQRAEELSNIIKPKPILVIDEIQKCIAYCQQLKNTVMVESNDVYRALEIKIYDANPSITYYACDNISYVGFFSVKDRADFSPHLEVPLTTLLGNFVQNRFAELWDHAEPLEDFLENPRNAKVAEYANNFLKAHFS